MNTGPPRDTVSEFDGPASGWRQARNLPNPFSRKRRQGRCFPNPLLLQGAALWFILTRGGASLTHPTQEAPAGAVVSAMGYCFGI